ncbi:DUF7916 family protein [Desmospora profundinema]|uniref:DUF7916 domain-containing protein n=1 Tax=Desmospora profundinema TaxID=1571184 RepID=A0ABU1IT70_9BACL|nr:haloacid dehalogenase-like hydrolase [Desmospora profundinema]MDR6227129.1 hypothetical protein [Desmospora profundinema]
MEKPVKRLLDQTPEQLVQLTGRRLLESIRASEGRTVVAETVVDGLPLVDGCANPELAAAFGADLLLLNRYDVDRPRVSGFSSREEAIPRGTMWEETGLGPLLPIMGWGVTAGEVTRLIGRPAGINLEPVAADLPQSMVASGRRAGIAQAEEALDQGARFLVFTGNPGTGVTWSSIAREVGRLRDHLGPEIPLMAGKMHGAGVWENDENWLEERQLDQLAEAGANILLLPQPGTVPGVRGEEMACLVERAHRLSLLVMFTIGTSQESSQASLMERWAVEGKSLGGDLFHIGDAGFAGMAPPENILSFSTALKGKRHTYRRIAQSRHR